MRTFLAKGPYLEALENRSENITLEEAAGNVPLNVAKTFVPNIDAIRVDKVDCSQSETVPAMEQRVDHVTSKKVAFHSGIQQFSDHHQSVLTFAELDNFQDSVPTFRRLGIKCPRQPAGVPLRIHRTGGFRGQVHPLVQNTTARADGKRPLVKDSHLS